MGDDGKARFSDHDYVDVWKVSLYHIVYIILNMGKCNCN